MTGCLHSAAMLITSQDHLAFHRRRAARRLEAVLGEALCREFRRRSAQGYALNQIAARAPRQTSSQKSVDTDAEDSRFGTRAAMPLLFPARPQMLRTSPRLARGGALCRRPLAGALAFRAAGAARMRLPRRLAGGRRAGGASPQCVHQI